MNYSKRVLYIFLLTVMSLMFSVCSDEEVQRVEEEVKLKGVKVYLDHEREAEQDSAYYVKLLEEIQSKGGFNTVFVNPFEGQTAYYNSTVFPNRDRSIDVLAFRQQSDSAGIDFGAVCQVFYDPDIVESRPELIPVDQYGSREYESWQKMVCPCDSSYVQFKLSAIREVIDVLQPDILALDFIRFPSFWESIPPDADMNTLRQFGFNRSCIDLFIEQTGITPPGIYESTKEKADWILEFYQSDWVSFRCSVIESFVEKVYAFLRASNIDAKLMIHLVPWSKQDYPGWMREMVAQDTDLLGNYADYFSPMLYHRMIGRDKSYIKDYIESFPLVSRVPLIPSIQAPDANDTSYTVSEYREIISIAESDPSAGYSVFHWGRVKELPE